MGEALQRARRDGAAVQKLRGLRLRPQERGLYAQAGLDFEVQRPCRPLVYFHLVVHRVGEPRLQVVVEHLVAPQHQERDRTQLNSMAPTTSLVRIREPSRLAWRAT